MQNPNYSAYLPGWSALINAALALINPTILFAIVSGKNNAVYFKKVLTMTVNMKALICNRV
jgi:hypothetical protein